MANKFIVYDYQCYKVVLTPEELEALLKKDPEVWAKAIGRGKGFKRAAGRKVNDQRKHNKDMSKAEAKLYNEFKNKLEG